jgi:acylglycerol lipase
MLRRATLMSQKPRPARASYVPARRLIVRSTVPQNGVHASGFFAATDGATLFEQSWLPHEWPRAKVVLVHGLYDHGSRYGALAAVLVERGFGVYSFDLRGHGHSEGVRGDFVLDEHLADFATFVGRVGRRPRTDRPARVVLVGQGVGSIIGLLYAIESRVPIAGFASLALGTWPSRTDSIGGRLAAVLRPESRVVPPDMRQVSRDPLVVRSCLADPLIWGGGLTRRAAAEVAAGWKRLRGEARDLRSPLLALQGGADALSDAKEAGGFFSDAGCDDKMMHVYVGLAHDLLHEPEREGVVRDLVSWVEAHV